jgi:phosphonate transport system permease protein
MPLRDPAWRGRVTWLVLGAVLLWPMLVASEFEPWRLFDEQAIAAASGFLGSFLPPAVGGEFLLLVAEAAWITVATATAGLALALVGAIPLTLIGTSRLSQSALGRPMRRLPFAVRQLVRWLLIFLRSVPELVWALLFVRVVGLGPTAGVLAIALTYCGMLGKVYSEVLESSDGAPTDAILRNGGSRLQAFLYGSLPQSAPELVSYTVFRWECAVRSSVIMGFVGGGGLGQQMDMSMKMLAGGEVFTMLAVFVLLVALADVVSRALRRRLEGTAHDRRTVADAPERQGGQRESSAAHSAPAAPASTGALGWLAAIAALAVASFVSLELRWRDFLAADALSKMGEFVGGFFPPEIGAPFMARIAQATVETLAMSAIGTLIAVVAGLALALMAGAPERGGALTALRRVTRFLLNLLRSIPELVWAALWVIAAGLGPFPGTLALAAHTTGVIGRLFADTLENLPPAPARALRDNGVSGPAVFLYATLPLALPQMVSYTLYRWENNIRAAAVLGVVGAGGLGQMLYFHLSLFQMQEAATVVLAMLAIVAAVDALSYAVRNRLSK